MLRRFLALAAVALLLPAAAQAQGEMAEDDPFATAPVTWTPFGEAMKRAKAEDKPIVLHAYATWCGWCQKFNREVFPDEDVKAMLDERYIVARLNIESADSVMFRGGMLTEQELSGALGVRGVPAHVFFSPEGERLTLLPGYAPADQFIHVLRYIADKGYDTESFEEYMERVMPAPGTDPNSAG
jgi:thioredoxin-related protein